MKLFKSIKSLFQNSSISSSIYGGAIKGQVINEHETPTLIPQIVVLHEGDMIQLDSDGGMKTSSMKVIRKIDTGGFGTVFIVDLNGKEYALKVLTLWLKLPKEWSDLIKRFESSFRAGKINSPFIIKYHDKGYYKGNPCILMEYCPNGHLESKMEEFYPKEKWTKLGIDLLKALRDLHANGIIHKDFKPKNILFSKDDVPKLTDFDFSAFLDKRNTITRGGRALDLWYTAIYSPPEQIDPNLAYEKTSPPLDMFAFAVTMYQVITGGKLPWGTFEEYHQNPEAYYEKIKTGDFVPISSYRADIPSDWAYNIERCLQPRIEDRVQTPAQFLQFIRYNEVIEIENKEERITDEEQPLNSPIGSEKFHFLEIKAGANNIGFKVPLDELKEGSSTKYLTIGRSADSTIHVDAILPSEGVHHVSRYHATIKYNQDEDRWAISDGFQNHENTWKESTNGTEVFNPISGNNNIIPSSAFTSLEDEDIINLAGEVTIKFFKVKP